jgi:hypothetical protein
MYFARFHRTSIILILTLALSGCTLPPEAYLIPTPTPIMEAVTQADTEIDPVTADETRREQTVQQPGAHTDVAAAATHPDLAAALEFAPINSDHFAYTNWTFLKAVAGVPDLTSADDMDDRFDFVGALGRESQATGSMFGRTGFMLHAEIWGWDSTDLDWEANFVLDSGPPVYVLRLRQDFDLEPVLARFEERGFTATDYAGYTRYSHAMDLQAEWLRATEFAILNTLILPEERVFILSSAPEAPLLVLDSWLEQRSLAARPDVSAAAAALGDAGAVYLSPAGCLPFDVAALLGPSATPENMAAAIEELRQTGIQGHYTVLALGYQILTDNGEETPVGMVVHHYPLTAQAEADLAPRRVLAETGNSLARPDTSYADLFEVLDAAVLAPSAHGEDIGANLVLTLRARDRTPQLFFDMLYQRDMLFSVCGGF